MIFFPLVLKHSEHIKGSLQRAHSNEQLENETAVENVELEQIFLLHSGHISCSSVHLLD